MKRDYQPLTPSFLRSQLTCALQPSFGNASFGKIDSHNYKHHRTLQDSNALFLP
jgi:hypothetical protein